ncbi:hypothetical protein DLE60_08045 [Micromonospora globispora]|uniref:Uncharacterized protein n=1 Tax=Micromonospora globispora TaxID=1450148 RepID=A0A317K430_9ACTN|nr:hypothetical protein DLJ46_13960 [Micromonospora globispora]PWU60964.1 hypothetical protein DLE60_08045 [Micromonospora globispora]RQW82863.1 hypothetical protein DKL51_32680 [Micromonospora globispora]
MSVEGMVVERAVGFCLPSTLRWLVHRIHTGIAAIAVGSITYLALPKTLMQQQRGLLDHSKG